VRLHFVTAVGSPSFVVEVVTNGSTEIFDSVDSFATYRESL
ncbi:MAG: hypothetical protein RL197_1108, partial [Actinomycetota bacterium]